MITLELSTFSENLPRGKEIALQNTVEFELGGPSRHICARGGGVDSAFNDRHRTLLKAAVYSYFQWGKHEPKTRRMA